MKNAWGWGFLSRRQDLSCPFDFPFGGDFAPAFFAAAFGGSGVPTAAATAGGVAGAAFAGTAGVPAFEETDFFGLFSESSMDLAFTSSRSSTKNSCKKPPKVVKVSHTRIFWGSLDFINDPLKPTNSAKLLEQKLTKHPLIGPILRRDGIERFNDLA